MEINLLDYVSAGMMILVVLDYVMGMFCKSFDGIKDKYITAILMAFSIAFGCALSITAEGMQPGTILNGIVQGIICWGVSIGINQTIKQIQKKE